MAAALSKYTSSRVKRPRHVTVTCDGPDKLGLAVGSSFITVGHRGVRPERARQERDSDHNMSGRGG